MSRAALAMISLTAWSGDAWHMNTAMRQWAAYTSWIKNAGLLSHHYPDYQTMIQSTDFSVAHNMWRDQEVRSRLVNAWISMDLELSIFFDAPPKLAIKDLDTSIPTNIEWENVRSTNDILAAYTKLSENFGSAGKETSVPTFHDLFQKFLERDISRKKTRLTPQQLKALLHGIQCLASHLYECLVNFFDYGPRFYLAHKTTDFGTKALLHELQSLLDQWYAIYHYSIGAFDAQDPSMIRTLLLWHLMSVRVRISFEHLETLARAEPSRNFFQNMSHVQDQLRKERRSTNFHCGQIIKLVRTLPQDKKPAWWAAAVYRAIIFLWSTSWAYIGTRPSSSSNSGTWDYPNDPTLPIDCVNSNDEILTRYLREGQGVPVLTTQTGDSVRLEAPDNILAFGLTFLDEQGDHMRLVEGIKSRLMRLRERWGQAQ
ncbi:MAG: hypothetical protein M1821_007513 [Bathelium mastoideum]|nr:MAG: hypothetical protein M1821_007513 [Bathelium mastoideum]